ncbi:hypothetical protein [Rickettsia honei]|uniref:hypothetical protein n=1 Tax=Rickettsia honei TaxID=37816 RepID=UPI000309B2F3|nr:hypothetical protein [Rickettsia honei]
MSQLPLAVEFENSANEIAGESELMVSLEVNYTETDILPTIYSAKRSRSLFNSS